MRPASLLVELCHFPALSENTSCGATQHLIYRCAQPCGVATAPPRDQDLPLQLNMAECILRVTLCEQLKVEMMEEIKRVMLKEHAPVVSQL